MRYRKRCGEGLGNGDAWRKKGGRGNRSPAIGVAQAIRARQRLAWLICRGSARAVPRFGSADSVRSRICLSRAGQERLANSRAQRNLEEKAGLVLLQMTYSWLQPPFKRSWAGFR